MIKAVIFDMDGVIIDSEPIQSKSLEGLLKYYNKTPQYNNQGLLHEVGVSGDKSYMKFKNTYDIPDDIPTLREKRRKIYENLLQEKLASMPGVTNLIKRLKKENFKIALASNRFIEHVFLILDNLNIRSSFEAIVGPSETIKHKPSPDIYIETAKVLNIQPAECVVIEDSETGVMAGVAAGMKVIVVPNKYTTHQDFSKADRIINSLNEIDISLIQSL